MKSYKCCRYSKILLFLAINLTILFSWGCVSMEGPATRLQTSPGFEAKKVYSHNFDYVCDRISQCLR